MYYDYDYEYDSYPYCDYDPLPTRPIRWWRIAQCPNNRLNFTKNATLTSFVTTRFSAPKGSRKRFRAVLRSRTASIPATTCCRGISSSRIRVPTTLWFRIHSYVVNKSTCTHSLIWRRRDQSPAPEQDPLRTKTLDSWRSTELDTRDTCRWSASSRGTKL